MKKITKVALTVGGLLAFSELFAAIGESQMAVAIHSKYPNEIDDCLEALDNAELYNKNPYAIAKCKFVSWFTKLAIK